MAVAVRVPVRRSTLAAAAFLALAASGCGRVVESVLLPNQAPKVEMTRVTLESSGATGNSYRVTWQGQDFDGRIDHYLYAIDPPSVDRAGPEWWPTRETSRALAAPAFTGIRPPPHVFAVRAVDDRGGVSDAVWFAYAADNLPPSVFITTPQPSPITTAIVPTSVRIAWNGVDPDGQFTTRPVKYKFRLFPTHNADFPEIPDFIAFALQNPDSLRNLYAPGFAGWDSLPGDSTAARYTNLVPNQIYLFVVTGFDEVGDYDPVFSASKNMLRMGVVEPCTIGPRLCLFSDNFYFCYASGGCSTDPSRYVKVEMPAEEPIRIRWTGTPVEGAPIRAYRWVLDPENLADETPRSDEVTDWYHWSAWSLTNTEAVVGPIPTYETKRNGHLLYVEVEDVNGLRSLGIVNFIVVPPTFTEPLLFVNDTRRQVDQFVQGELQPPRGPWPTAAELDSFLFARGGFPWRGYPLGTSSTPGIFAGYRFDTLGTRRLPNGVPLSVLASYRTVVWMVDDVGATFSGSPLDLFTPITNLRRMTSPGQANVLATYLQQGGRLWLLGGGAAFATLAAWNRIGTAPDEFTNADGELVPGRFMYDFGHWRSAVMSYPAEAAYLNIPAFQPPYPNAAPGRGWSGQGVDRNLSMPSYAKLENASTGAPYLTARTCLTDPAPPLRVCDAFYLVPTYTAEFMGTRTLAGENLIREDADQDPNVTREESTLDTLYFTAGGTVPYGRPVMTYYHGFDSSQLVFSGFPLWHFQRSQVVRLADFVMQDIFGLFRTELEPASASAPPAIATRVRPRPPANRR
jgi:hypothetical protein